MAQILRGRVGAVALIVFHAVLYSLAFFSLTITISFILTAILHGKNLFDDKELLRVLLPIIIWIVFLIFSLSFIFYNLLLDGTIHMVFS